MPITQIIGITLTIMAFIATVIVFYNLFKRSKIDRIEARIKEIEHKLKSEYNTMTPIEVNKLYIKHNQIKHELFKLQTTKQND